jgi:hypothetical protein
MDWTTFTGNATTCTLGWMWNRNCFAMHWTSWYGRTAPASPLGYYWEACCLTKIFLFRSSFLVPHFFFGAWSLVLFSCLWLCSTGFLVSFLHLFFPLTYVYDMCKCGGVIRYTVHRPKYPSKSSLFLGSLSDFTPLLLNSARYIVLFQNFVVLWKIHMSQNMILPADVSHQVASNGIWVAYVNFYDIWVLQQGVVSRLDMYRTKVLMYRTMVLLARLTKVRR